EVSSTAVLRDRVIPFFDRYVVPFSCKSETFMRFKEILEMMQRREHLRDHGLAEIVRKVYSMNPASKGRARLRPLDEVRTRILRDHTPDIQSPDWMMRWSPLHGDMQGVASKEVPLRSEQTCPNKTEAKFLVG